MPYRLVIFDCDGTLVDSFPWFQEVINDVASRFGLPHLDEAKMEILRSTGSPDIVKQLGVPRWKVPMIVRHMRRLKARDLHRTPLFPGVPEMLVCLKEEDTTLAIVSSDTEANVRQVLGTLNAGLIDTYDCGVPIFGKPGRLRRLLRRGRFRPDEVIAIGDEIRDIEAARSAGIACGAVSWGYARPAALAAHAPTVIYATVDEIPKHVVGSGGGGQC